MKKSTKIILLLLMVVLTITGLFACNQKAYTISFLSFGDEVEIITHKGIGEIVLSKPTRQGYKFLGWFLDDNVWNNPFTDTYFSDKKIDKNYVVYARWQAIEYVTVKFECYGGQEIEPVLVEKGKEPILPTPIKGGFTFLGWCTDAYLNKKVDSNSMLKDNVKVYAKWLSDVPLTKSFIVNIVIPDRNNLEVEVQYGEKLIVPKIRRIGYKLDKFFTDNKFMSIYDTNILVTADFYLYSSWYDIEQEYNINFITNYDSTKDPIKARYDELITISNLTREGYMFEGWFVDNEFKSAFDTVNDGIVSDLTLYAKWRKEDAQIGDKDTYIIIFVKNGGVSDYDSQSALIGEEPYLEPPKKHESEFMGWFFDEQLTKPYSYDASNTDDITLYAKWNKPIVIDNFKISESLYNGLKIVEYTGSETIVSIPQSHNGINIVEIGDNAFLNNTDIAKVELTSFITHIGDSSFENCTSLVEVTSYSSVQNFENCTSLVEVTSYSSVQNIGIRAFYQSGINKMSFSETLQQIGNQAFSLSAIEEITLDGDAIIGESSFENCPKLTTVTMKAVTTIGQKAFNDCKILVDVKLDSCQTIMYCAFCGCTALKTIKLPNCTILETSAFEKCTNLTTVSVPSVKNVQSNTFNSTGIDLIDLPKVEHIGNGAFANCWKLVNVNIGQFLKIESLEAEIFNNSDKIIIDISTENQNLKSNSGSILSNDGKNLIAVGGISNDSYAIPNGVETVAMFAFGSGATIKNLTIPASTINVDMSLAFIEMLESIVVDSDNISYQKIDGNLYDMDKKLIRYIPQSIATEFTIDNSITGIYSGAFSYCANLTSITLDTDITVIDFAAFYKCYSLEQVINSQQITEYKDYCFRECSNLTTIDFGIEIMFIGENAFTDSGIRLDDIPVIDVEE